MIDSNYLNDLKIQNKGILHNYLTTELTFPNYIIMPQIYDIWQMRRLVDVNGNVVRQGIMSDNPDYILRYTEELCDVEFTDILVGGLGLGLVPYVCKGFSNVDVVEIDQEIIDITNTISHLSGVNIIKSNIFTYTPTKSYDIIFFDIWDCQDCQSDLQIQINTLLANYLPYLKQNGYIYIPINKNIGDVIFRNIENTPPPTPFI